LEKNRDAALAKRSNTETSEETSDGMCGAGVAVEAVGVALVMGADYPEHPSQNPGRRVSCVLLSDHVSVTR
jgi:hypothetical protein